MTEPAELDLSGVPIRTLAERVCEVEAHLAVLAELGSRLRAELVERAVGTWRADGVAPTYRIPGLGTVTLVVPKTKVAISDPEAFGSWCAQHHPAEVRAHITLTDVPPENLDRLLEEVRAWQLDDTGRSRFTLAAAVQVTPGFPPTVLDAALVLGDVAANPDGVPIDGVTVHPGPDPSSLEGPQPRTVSVRLEAQAKADAAAQASARLPAILTGGLAITPATPPEPASGPAGPPDGPAEHEHEPADGAPDEDDPDCACTHPASKHPHGYCEAKIPGARTQDPAVGCPCKQLRPVVTAW